MRRASAVAVAALIGASTFGASAAAARATDPLRDEQWALDRIGVDDAWSVTRGAGAVVAIVDTGVALEHPDLFHRILKRPDGSVIGLDLVDGDGDPSDEHGHGTLVAGVVAATADDGRGIAGVAPEAKLLPVRVLAADGSGTSEQVGRGVRWAVDQGANVVNVSLEAVAPADGSPGRPGVPPDAVRYAADRGVLVVAAAGNRAGSARSYRDDAPILLVGATDERDRLAPYSTVDRDDALVAPGVNIVSTWCRRTSGGCDPAASPYGVAEGTSFAAPHVSGVAALLFAQGLELEQVRERLLAGAVDLGPPGPDPAHGAGRVDAAASLGAPGARTARTTSRAPGTTPAPTPAPVPRPDPEPQAPVAPPPVEVEPDPEPVPEPEPIPVEDPVPSPVDVVVEAEDVEELAAPPVQQPSPPRPVAFDALPQAASDVPGSPPGRTVLAALAAVLLVSTMGAWSRAARRCA